MPSKKKRYNSRFPPARIKKIMQSDEDVGKVAAAVPVIISRALELFVETLLKGVNEVAQERGARTLTPSHIKRCIHSETRLHFMKEMVAPVPELTGDRDDSHAAVPHPPPPSSTQMMETRAPHRRKQRGPKRIISSVKYDEEATDSGDDEELNRIAEEDESSSSSLPEMPSTSTSTSSSTNIPFTIVIPNGTAEENGDGSSSSSSSGSSRPKALRSNHQQAFSQSSDSSTASGVLNPHSLLPPMITNED
uniref:Dr1-associated corepressor n=1 Tax=Caligus clemensi TaxID=344056 RepID=C1C0U3_CALCM|nr:Dr1-associated corepressor [Caligus clemensi]